MRQTPTELTALPGTGMCTVETMSLYACALRRGGITADDQAIFAELGLTATAAAAAAADLVRLHLLRDENRDGRRWLIPVNPEVATAILISPLDEEVLRRQAEISEIRARLSAFRPHYEETRRGTVPGPGIEPLRDAEELAGQFYVAAGGCHRELISFRPSGWLTPEQAAALLGRGVHVRLLLQHSVRTDIRARARLDKLIGGGGEVRTIGQLPRQLTIFDSEVAFLLHDEEPGGLLGVMIKHADTVRLLRDVAESTWAVAQPYLAKRIGYQEVADNLQRTIVELLADGLTDEAIARRLGVSVRTCRRHIATVLRSLDSVSRFQAGVRATAAGLVDSPPGSPAHPLTVPTLSMPSATSAI
jgi:DNA-binding CsgD family transcriptional regulator